MFASVLEALETSISTADATNVAHSLVLSAGLSVDKAYLAKRLCEPAGLPRTPLFWAVLRLVELSSESIDSASLAREFLTTTGDVAVAGLLELLPKYKPILHFEISDLEMAQTKRLCQLVEKLPEETALRSALLAELLAVDLRKCTAQHRSDVVFCLKRLIGNGDFLSSIQHAPTKVELVCQLLQKAEIAAIRDSLTLGDCAEAASSPIKTVRRQAQYLLDVIFNFPDSPVFWAIQDALDEYSSHLLKEIFESLSVLVDTLPSVFLEHLLTRALTHDNDGVRKFVLSVVVKQQSVMFISLLSDAFIIEFILPAFSAFASAFNQPDFASNARTFLALLAADHGSLLIEFISSKHPHAKLVLELLDVLQNRVDLCSLANLIDFVTSGISAYPAFLRDRMVNRTLSCLKAECWADRGSVSVLARLVAVVPKRTLLPGSCGFEGDSESLRDFLGAGDLVERVGRLRLLLGSGGRELGAVVVEYLASEVMNFVSRVYAAVETVQESLVLLAVAVELTEISGCFVESVCEEVVLPLLERLLRSRGESVQEDLLRICPVAVVLLGRVRSEGVRRGVQELCLSANKSGLVHSASLVCLLDAVEAELSMKECLSLEVVKGGDAESVFGGSELGLYLFGGVFAWKSREEVLDMGERSKWRIFGRAREIFPFDFVISNLSCISVNQLEPFSLVFTKSSTSVFLPNTVSFEDVTRVLNTVSSFIQNRNNLSIPSDGVRALMTLAFNPSTLSVASESCKKLLTLIMQATPLSPGYGRALIDTWTHLLASPVSSFASSFSDAIADVLLLCRDEGEECEADLVLGLLLAVDQQPDLACSVISSLLQKLDISRQQTEASKRSVCPMPGSDVHKFQRNGWRAISALLKHLPATWDSSSVSQTDSPRRANVEMLKGVIFGLVSILTQPDVRDLEDLVMCYLVTKYPEQILPEISEKLKTSETSVQALSTFILAAGYYATGQRTDSAQAGEVMELLVPYLTSNTALLRAQAQFWLSETREADFPGHSTLGRLREYVRTCKDTQAVLRKMQPIFARLEITELIDSEVELIVKHLWSNTSLFMEDVKAAVREGMTEIVLTHDERAQLLIEQEKMKMKKTSEDVKTETNYQRKYDPKGDDGKQESAGTTRKTELVILASFVDKVTNLAGLSRTAEIFGARKLLVANEKVLADREFKAMSMTSEKWLEIEEVRTESVKQVIKKYREEGYTIVALEQTSNSVSLGAWEFPSKTLLILGSEGHGVPVWCLADIDVTVEIPQIGVVRSLNVHVSAALAVWEYNKTWTKSNQI